MIKIFILLIAVAVLGSADPLKAQVTVEHLPGREYLSHSRVALEDFIHQSTSLRRHDLSSAQIRKGYEQAPLQTNHYGFNLKLKIANLTYKLSMDTGSSDFFIKGENSPGVPNKKYKSGQNYEAKQLIQIGYLDGRLKTYQTNLPVEFNGHKFNASLLVAYTAPPQFENVQGIVGLSYPSLAKHQPTFIQTLMKENIVQKYAYGMNLNLIQQNRSFISFGQADPELYQGQLTTFDIKNSQKSKKIKVDFDYLTVGISEKMRLSAALLDTGNTCISIPRKFQQDILDQFSTTNNKCFFMVQENVPMFSLLMCKIRSFDELPVIILSMGGKDFVIQKQYYLQRCTTNPQQKGNNKYYYCDTYIESVDYSDKEMIFLGDGFFNRFYTYFDLEDEKVGIAKNKENITLKDIFESQPYPYKPQDWKILNE